MTWWQNLLLAFIEGLTEFLPISSTAHLKMASEIMGLSNIDNYIITIQFGAILAVVVLYRKEFFTFRNWSFYIKLLVGFIPVAIVGLLFNDLIEQTLEKPFVIGAIVLLGGIFLLFVDKIFKPGEKNIEDLNFKQAGIIGIFQCISIFLPGFSRAASGILGGLFVQLNRVAATEFSFFLAVPTISAAACYTLLKNYKNISSDQMYSIAWGNVLSFLIAIAAIKFFIALVKKSGFSAFGWYRIAIGSVFLLYLAFR